MKTLQLDETICQIGDGKKLRICFHLSPLKIDDHVQETAQSYKVLGLIIQKNLKYEEQILSVVAKAFKRLNVIDSSCTKSWRPESPLLTFQHMLCAYSFIRWNDA